MPDDRLFDLAKAEELSKPQVLEQEVQRMLLDDRSAEFVTRFADQWFDLAALDRVAVQSGVLPRV